MIEGENRAEEKVLEAEVLGEQVQECAQGTRFRLENREMQTKVKVTVTETKQRVYDDMYAQLTRKQRPIKVDETEGWC